MDDRGRLAQSLTGIARWRSPHAARTSARAAPGTSSFPPQEKAWMSAMSRRVYVVCARSLASPGMTMRPRSRYAQILDRWSLLLAGCLPPGAGIVAASIVILASLAYGAVKGDHLPAAAATLKDARDWVANAAGLRIMSVALTGNHHVSREEVLAIAGVTGTTSLVFLDVEQARERLKSNPWIADATVLKLYPRELQISIKEREAFALWQKAGAVSVIADDGTVLEPYVAPRLIRLPLVVGAGAETKAKEFLALLDRHSAMRDLVRASVLVGERRWNLRLKNGVEVRLPESGVAAALERLVALDGEKNLIARDVGAIDLRLPDRVTVRLSDAAAQARMDAIKETPKKKGGFSTPPALGESRGGGPFVLQRLRTNPRTPAPPISSYGGPA
jgi:cell division protein FtsQ